MKRISKISWAIAGLSFVLLIVVRILLGHWVDVLLFPLILFFVFSMVAVFSDLKLYSEFLTLKTTKHGMNMGLVILLSLVLLVAVNYFSVRFEKTWDLTEEGLNSLSPHSVKVMNKLDSSLKFFVFYTGSKDYEAKKNVLSSLDLYRFGSPLVQIRPVDAYVERALAQDYLAGVKNPASPFVMLEYKEQRIKVDAPFGEVQVTSAIIKATREASKIVYLLRGHGERNLEGEGDDDMGEFLNSLKESSYEVKSLSLLEGSPIPKDASLVALIGPAAPLLEGELKQLMEYGRSGGRLFIAADPGQRHHIALLSKAIGVEFKNNYILNDRIRLMGRGAASSLGLEFNGESEITRSFRSGENMALFDLASEVVKAPQAASNLKTKELVLTPPSSYIVNDLSKANEPGDRRAISVGVSVQGKLSLPSGKEKKRDDEKATLEESFAAVVFGDSDFLSNKAFFQGINRDLAMNAIAFLTKETDLISLRAKQPKGTKLVMTSFGQMGLILSSLGLPVLLFAMAGLIWYRRRGA